MIGGGFRAGSCSYWRFPTEEIPIIEPASPQASCLASCGHAQRAAVEVWCPSLYTVLFSKRSTAAGYLNKTASRVGKDRVPEAKSQLTTVDL